MQRHGSPVVPFLPFLWVRGSLHEVINPKQGALIETWLLRLLSTTPHEQALSRFWVAVLGSLCCSPVSLRGKYDEAGNTNGRPKGSLPYLSPTMLRAEDAVAETQEKAHIDLSVSEGPRIFGSP